MSKKTVTFKLAFVNENIAQWLRVVHVTTLVISLDCNAPNNEMTIDEQWKWKKAAVA
jgi:hypothetical protein